jgi:hypothetical protein
MLFYAGYQEGPCASPEPMMARDHDEAGVAAMRTGGESPSAASVDSAVFGSVDSPTCGAATPSPTWVSPHFALDLHGQSPSDLAFCKTSAGPPALIADVIPKSSFTMPPGCTFHGGFDNRRGINHKRSRSASVAKRRNSTKSMVMPVSGRHCAESPQQQNSLPNPQQRQIGSFLVTQPTVGDTEASPLDLTMEMDTNC